MAENPYDDPYVMAAHYILSAFNRAEIQRIIQDDEFLARQIVKETRLQDFSGALVDCIIQSILDDKKRMEFMHQLDELALYFYRNLDKERLRQDIVRYGVRYGII